MDYLPVGSCNPQSSGYEGDSALYYSNTPMSCRLVNALSIVVMIAAGLGGLAIAYRGDSFGLSLNNAPAGPAGATAPPPMNPEVAAAAALLAVVPPPDTSSSRHQIQNMRGGSPYSSIPNREVQFVEATAVLASSQHEHIPMVTVISTPASSPARL
jgi:hypothetical protein